MRRRYIIAIVLLVIAGFGVLELTGVTHVFRKKPAHVASGSSFNSKGEKKNSSDQSAAQTSGGTSSYNNNKGVGSSAILLTPSGDFVSNHHPNLSGSPAPNTESSVCNTTPGASCTITFTKDGVTKSLPAQAADTNGFVNWNWKLQDIGLTSGTWKIKAVATLGSQNKSASDAMDMVVGQ